MNALRSIAATLLAAVGLLAALAAPASAQQKKQRDLITREELLSTGQENRDLFEAIRNLRPHFLQAPRGVRSLGNAAPPPKLLVIGTARQPGLDGLRSIPASTVQEVRYFEPSKAEGEYGPAGGSGAIVIKLYDPTKVKKDSAPPARD
jgi:hypothetical protein